MASADAALPRLREHARQPGASFAPARVALRALAERADATARERRLARAALRHVPADGYAVSEQRVRVRAGERVTIAVAPAQRRVVSLVFTRRARAAEHPRARGVARVRDGDAAVTFRACTDSEFLGGLVVAGARCVELLVSRGDEPARRVRVPFGRGARCSPLAREPYLGVSCPEANSIACDPVGLAVWLRRAAARVTATVQGRPLVLTAPERDGRDWWQGFLQPAGLIDGPLRVIPDRDGSWSGREARDARVTLAITRRSGVVEREIVTVPLRAGWG